MSNIEIFNYVYFISMGIVIGYIIWCLLYDYFINLYNIDIADLLGVSIGIILACIPYVNVIVAFLVVVRVIIIILECIVSGLVNIWNWVECHKKSGTLNKVIFTNRKSKKVSDLNGYVNTQDLINMSNEVEK